MPYAVTCQTASLTTRDGVRLDADVYRPEGATPFPVLLMRQPYGRAIASTVVYAHPRWYASQGYLVVIQDVRGRGTSQGEFQLFAHEAADGYDTVQWAAQLPGSSGAVGMYGFSYQGMTQLYAAAAHPPALKALAPAMVGYDLYADWAYENGALLLQAGLGWGLQLAAETARLRGDAQAYRRLYQAARQLPVNDDIPARPDILGELAADSFYLDWLDHPQPDGYWQSLQPNLTDVDLPMLHVGGWFDPYLRGNLRLFEQMSARSSLQQLWVGPWGHIPWARRVGAVDFGPEAQSPIDALQVRWFDHCLKAPDPKLRGEAPVRLFEMGTNRWRSYQQWPTQAGHTYYFTSSGLAAMRQDDGQLRCDPAAAAHQDGWVHDPWRPVPAVGGHSAVPSGSFDRAATDGRSDVLTYTTAPLSQPLAVAGAVTLEVIGSADAPSFDLSAVVSAVKSDGRVFNLTQGYGRFAAEPHQPQRLALPLQPTCFQLPPGEALRVSLSASCFPAYPVNPGTGSPAGSATLLEQQIITLSVHHGPEQMSQLLLAYG